jgi:hypothetical protein
LQALPENLIFFPLGKGAAEALDWLVTKGLVPAERVFSGLPHPSPANVERFDYFIGRSRARRVRTRLIQRCLTGGGSNSAIAWPR